MINKDPKYVFKGMNSMRSLLFICSIWAIFLIIFLILFKIHAFFWGKTYLVLCAFLYCVIDTFIIIIYMMVSVKKIMITLRVYLETNNISIYNRNKIILSLTLDKINKVLLEKSKSNESPFRNMTIYYQYDKKFDVQVGEFAKDEVIEFDRFFLDFRKFLLDLNFTLKKTELDDKSVYIYTSTDEITTLKKYC